MALDRLRHAGRSLPKPNYLWCRTLNAVQVHAQELSKAALSHPLVFTQLGGGDGAFIPIAVLGLEEGDNQSVDARGQWQPERYIPAYIRCYPFCIVRARLDAQTVRGVICVQETALVLGAPELFTTDGTATAAWTPIQNLLDATDAAAAQTEAFMQRLCNAQLLEAFEAIVLPKGGEQLRLKGLWRVNEEKLRLLTENQLRSLLHQGDLRAIYAHLLSLEHFAHLMRASRTAMQETKK